MASPIIALYTRLIKLGLFSVFRGCTYAAFVVTSIVRSKSNADFAREFALPLVVSLSTGSSSAFQLRPFTKLNQSDSRNEVTCAQLAVFEVRLHALCKKQVGWSLQENATSDLILSVRSCWSDPFIETNLFSTHDGVCGNDSRPRLKAEGGRAIFVLALWTLHAGDATKGAS